MIVRDRWQGGGVIQLTFLLGFFLSGLAASVARADVPRPTVTGPIGDAGLRGHPLWDSWFDLGELGYVEEEYFISGTANGHGASAGQTAPYTTRIIVTRPAAAKDFNGTVVLDWVNVTAQFENAVDTIAAHPMLLREGYGWVDVSAQAAGICCTPLTPKIWDPVRYEALSHPGDDYSFDIFSQVAKAVRTRRRNAVNPMGGLRVRRVIAVGQSQSAGRLSTYVRQVQQGADVIDGFLIHSGGSKSFAPDPPVPVLHLLSDFEATLDGPNATTNYVLWEIAGSAHSDFWIGYHQEAGQGPRSQASAPKLSASADEELHRVAGNYGEQLHPGQLVCILQGGQFPMRYAVSAAIRGLDRWLRKGTIPPTGSRFTFDSSGQLALDGFGNALGGIRLPPIEHPVATYASRTCALGGITIPFSEALLNALYPTHADYYCKMEEATAESVAAGFLLPEDGEDLMSRVCLARNRWALAGVIDCDGDGAADRNECPIDGGLRALLPHAEAFLTD